MTQDPDEDRIRRKAHELWEAEGHPHGRDQAHWEQAREIVAIEDSMASTLLPRTTGAQEPEEPALAIESLGDLPNLTDQGEHPLTDIAREPEQLSPGAVTHASGDTVGAVVRPHDEHVPGFDDAEIVSHPVAPAHAAEPAASIADDHATPGSVTSTPVAPASDRPAPVTGKTASKKATSAVSMVKVSKPRTSRKKK